MRDILLRLEAGADTVPIMRTAAASLALALVLGACTDGSPNPLPPTSVTTQPAPVDTASTTSAPTTSTSLGFERPIAIDVPYVQRVLDEIYRLEGEAARYIYAKGVPDAEFNERLKAIFGEPALGEAKSLFGQQAAQRFTRLANPPGNPRIVVRAILEMGDDCIVVRGDLDFRPLYKVKERTIPNGVVVLRPADVLPLNPTGWGVVAAGTPLPNQEGKTSSC